MAVAEAIDTPFVAAEEPAVCTECHSGSRLKNGLCLNCLLQGALETEDLAAGGESFKEALAAVKPLQGDWRIGDHNILDEIARGGMGVVYRALEPHSGRIVALKCVLAFQGDPSDQALARFRREAETAARLDHPNIVPIYRVSETADGLPFFTMKYAAGGSLLQARAAYRQEPRQSVLLVKKVALALQHAHERGVLHRDLKPGNILLDHRREPLVSDFGLARCDEIASHLTRSLTSFGTPGYIAPEQADGPAALLTPAADIYSLGAILFELLAGRLPFLGDNVLGVMKQSAERTAPKLRTLAPHLDRDLETICARCLEREPAARYPSAGSLADDLQSWLEGNPIAARPIGPWLHARRWVRRNRKLAALLASLLVVTSVSVGWQIHNRRLASSMRESLLASRSVVVLPFLDLDTVTEDGIATERVANSLRLSLENLGPARVSAASVPGWSKLEDIRKVAREAKSRAVMSGTVRSVQGERRIFVRLFDPTSGQVLFSKLLKQNEKQTQLEVAADLGRNIYQILNANDWSALANSTNDPGLRNESTAEAIKSGRAWMLNYTIFDLDHAIELFNKALTMEPDSALAHSYLASAASTRTHFVSDPKYLELGRVEALKALALEPDLADGHRALAGVYFQEGKFHEALEEMMRTIEIGGAADRITMFVGMTLDILGRPDRALSWYQISSKLQAQPGEIESPIGDSWAKLGEDEQAFRAYDRAIELQPGSSQGAVGKCHLHLLRDEFEAAREICRTRFRNLNELGELAQIAAQIEFFARNYAAAEELYAKLAKGDVDGGGSFYGAITYRSALGRIRQALGSEETASQLLRQSLESEIAAFNRQPGNCEAAYRLAAVEASLNLSRSALQHLDQAVALGWLDYRSLQRDPRFDSVRSDPQFNILIDGLSAKVAELRSTNKTKIK